MNDDGKRLTLVRRSGRTYTFLPGSTYWDVLDYIYAEHQTAGSNYDTPDLLLYGSGIWVSELGALMKYAWAYGKALLEAQEAAVNKVRALHKLDFMAVDGITVR